MKKLTLEMLNDFDKELTKISEDIDCGLSEVKLKRLAKLTFIQMFPDVSREDREFALRTVTDLFDE